MKMWKRRFPSQTQHKTLLLLRRCHHISTRSPEWQKQREFWKPVQESSLRDWCQLSKVPHSSKKNKVGFWSGTLHECSDALLAVEAGSSNGSIHGVCVCVTRSNSQGRIKEVWLNRLSMYCRVAHVTLPFMNDALFIHCLYLFRPHDLKVTMHWIKKTTVHILLSTHHINIQHTYSSLWFWQIMLDFSCSCWIQKHTDEHNPGVLKVQNHLTLEY